MVEILTERQQDILRLLVNENFANVTTEPEQLEVLRLVVRNKLQGIQPEQKLKIVQAVKSNRLQLSEESKLNIKHLLEEPTTIDPSIIKEIRAAFDNGISNIKPEDKDRVIGLIFTYFDMLDDVKKTTLLDAISRRMVVPNDEQKEIVKDFLVFRMKSLSQYQKASIGDILFEKWNQLQPKEKEDLKKGLVTYFETRIGDLTYEEKAIMKKIIKGKVDTLSDEQKETFINLIRIAFKNRNT